MQTVTCSHCLHDNPVPPVDLVDGLLRPDAKAAILDDTFQVSACEKCHGKIRPAPHFTYVHQSFGQWIAARDASLIDDWAIEEAKVRILAQTAEKAETKRLVFGWAALREKLLASDLSIADLPLELLKMKILREVPGAVFSETAELRLTGGDGSTLILTWIERSAEVPIKTLNVPREAYRDIDEQPGDWVDLSEKFDNALFVDMQRLVLG